MATAAPAPLLSEPQREFKTQGLTPEQQVIVAHEPKGFIRVAAGAGTGKTTTLRAYAKEHPGKGLYLAFNKAIATEANASFPKNVRAMTAHGYAFRALGVSQYTERLVGRIARPHIADSGINLANVNLSENRMQKALIKGLQSYMHSSRQKAAPDDFGIETLPLATQRAVMPILSAALGRFLNFQKSGLPFTHDIYLKCMQLSGRFAEDVDYLLIDEAQDLNEVLIALVESSGKPAIIVGDSFQSIYAFRGAVNAMRRFEGPELPLSQSWRYGEAVAKLANVILRHATVKQEFPLRGRPDWETKISAYAGRVPKGGFVLSRTNARLFEGLIKLPSDLTFHVAGGFETIASQVMSAFNLSQGNRRGISDQFIRMYDHWEMFVADAEDDPEIRRLVTLVKEYGKALPGIIDGLRPRHVQRPDRADIQLSTAHKAKGLEADTVVILDDFLPPSVLRERFMNRKMSEVAYNNEINLLYVSATRARLHLMLSDPLVGAFRSCLTEMPRAPAP